VNIIACAIQKNITEGMSFVRVRARVYVCVMEEKFVTT